MATALVVITGLSGCSGLLPAVTNLEHGLDGSAGKPRVGQCWVADYRQVDTAPTWNGGAPVACGSAHQAYTYAVPRLSGDFSGSWVEGGTDSQIRDDVWDSVYDTCQTALTQILPSYSYAYESRIAVGYYLPPVKAWEAGQRWVRCDVSVIGFGSRVRSPRLADLPESANAISGEDASGRFDLCLTTRESTSDADPLNSTTAVYADCRKSPQWRFDSASELPQDDGAPYPSDDTLDAYDQEHCGDKADAEHADWTVYVPTEKDWADDYRTVECWISASGAAPNT